MNITKIKKNLEAIGKAIENPNVFVFYFYLDEGRPVILDARQMKVINIIAAINNVNGVRGEFITVEAEREVYTA